MITTEEVKELIEIHIKNAIVFVTGKGNHFELTVVSEKFIDKNRIDRQKIVYAALQNRIADGSIHAVSMKTYTPFEWQNKEKS